MNDKQFEESIKKYYQDKMKNWHKRESAIYVDLNEIKEELKSLKGGIILHVSRKSEKITRDHGAN